MINRRLRAILHPAQEPCLLYPFSLYRQMVPGSIKRRPHFPWAWLSPDGGHRFLIAPANGTKPRSEAASPPDQTGGTVLSAGRQWQPGCEKSGRSNL